MSCVHIYCGDGKGKTTAAIGLAVRAAGRGKQVILARFLKSDDSGEVSVLNQLPGICLLPCQRSFGFYYQMTDKEKLEAAAYYSDLFTRVTRQAVEGGFDMMVLDEIMAACHHGLVDPCQLTDFIRKRPMGLEVVLTGRNPSSQLIDLADYVSEITKVKHPFDQGMNAREGIEY